MDVRQKAKKNNRGKTKNNSQISIVQTQERTI
jgi:hypothetical protein